MFGSSSLFARRLSVALLCWSASGCTTADASPDAGTTESVPPPSVVNVYASTDTGMLADLVRRAAPRVYVPNSGDGTVSVIDATTKQVVSTFPSPGLPQHVVPSWDMTQLWVANNRGNTLIAIDPVTGAPGGSVKVQDPYNLYFTPDGSAALVIAEREKRIDWRDPKTMELLGSTPVACRGANHLDYTADGKFAVVSCEFSGEAFRLDVAARSVTGYIPLRRPDRPQAGAMPQDVRLSPDGRVFFIADMMADGLFVVSADSLAQVGFIPTGIGAHGIMTGRGGRVFYVANRGWNTLRAGPRGPGSISVLDPIARKVTATWPVPGGGSPDMGNVTADGRELWVTGRYDRDVYVFALPAGEMTHRIRVGRGPHGLAVWPLPGRYSLGHTGNMR